VARSEPRHFWQERKILRWRADHFRVTHIRADGEAVEVLCQATHSETGEPFTICRSAEFDVTAYPSHLFDGQTSSGEKRFAPVGILRTLIAPPIALVYLVAAVAVAVALVKSL
jgi:hypothetical protein